MHAMIGFETDLDDLRASSAHQAAAADAAGAARDSEHQQDVPVAPPRESIFDISGLIPVDNAFGHSLGMQAVARAYENHRAKVEKMLAELHQSTLDSSRALTTVAELYERADEDSRTRLQRAAAVLDES